MSPALSSFLSQLHAAIALSPFLVLLGAAILAVGTLVITLLLFYHWKHYAVDPKEMAVVRSWYLAGISVLGAGMILSAVLYAVLAQV